MHETTVDSKYKVVRLIGQGGMGAVYEAQHLGTGRRVALKVITPSSLSGTDGDMMARFQREARASGAIDSQHVVQVLDTGVDPATSSPYLVMEFLSGEDLQHALQRCGVLPVTVVLRLMAQACAGLQRAHDAGIIHRDIKSANLFIARREGGDLAVKLLDFGIAKVRADPLAAGNQAITRTGSLLGSPLYMSPEQVLGSKHIDARTDLYSLGVTMYEALTGCTPNQECETLGLLVVAISGGRGMPVAQRAPMLPKEVASIVDKALALDPQARFQTASEMLGAIQALLPQGTTLNPSMFPGGAKASTPPPRDSNVEPMPSIGRTVPLMSPVPSLPPGGSTPPPASDVPPAVATTATAFTDTSPEAPGKRRMSRIVLAAAALLALGGLALGVHSMRAGKDMANVPLSASSEMSATGTAPAPPVSKDAPPVLEAASAATSASTPSIAPDVADATAPIAPATPVVIPQPVVRQRAVGAGAGAGANAGAGGGARPNCDPPYTFNADGKKIWKRECL